jgi:Amt family ammonium transporter
MDLSNVLEKLTSLDQVQQEVSLTLADVAQSSSEAMFTANNIWMMLATALVFIMHLGFAGVEAGLGQAKNTVNILFKNTITPIIGLVTYCICGFNLMYPGEFNLIPGFLGFSGFGIGFDAVTDGAAIDYAAGGYTYWTDFLFQAMFAATAATIVSGAIAERVKLSAYMVFTIVFVGLVYPILGSWKWGGGWLDQLGFYDFAGSTLVHAVGGFGALAGIIVIGPRIGKYANGKVNPKPGVSIPLAVIGVFFLWLGWFGFNGGSVLSADPMAVSYVLVTTCLAACTGGLLAFVSAYLFQKMVDLTMVLNGVLAGLVSITAGADVVSIESALLIGAIGGVLVVLGTMLLDKLKLDDMVGAVPVHLVCGVWGTLAVGIFGVGEFSLLTQLIGVLAYGAVSFPIAFGLFYILKVTVGVRVSAKEEVEGLDSHEHGMSGYSLSFDK